MYQFSEEEIAYKENLTERAQKLGIKLDFSQCIVGNSIISVSPINDETSIIYMGFGDSTRVKNADILSTLTKIIEDKERHFRELSDFPAFIKKLQDAQTLPNGFSFLFGSELEANHIYDRDGDNPNILWLDATDTSEHALEQLAAWQLKLEELTDFSNYKYFSGEKLTQYRKICMQTWPLTSVHKIAIRSDEAPDLSANALDICKKSKITFAKPLSRSSHYDFIEKCSYKLDCHEVPGSADDAATYDYYSWKVVDAAK